MAAAHGCWPGDGDGAADVPQGCWELPGRSWLCVCDCSDCSDCSPVGRLLIAWNSAIGAGPPLPMHDAVDRWLRRGIGRFQLSASMPQCHSSHPFPSPLIFGASSSAGARDCPGPKLPACSLGAPAITDPPAHHVTPAPTMDAGPGEARLLLAWLACVNTNHQPPTTVRT